MALPILFCIQAHSRSDYLIALARFLADGEHRVLINFDGPESDILAFRAQLNHPSIAVRRSVPAMWGSISLADALIDLFRAAAGDPQWSYLVLLSGECLPLKTPAEIGRICQGLHRRGKLAAFNLLFSTGARFYDEAERLKSNEGQVDKNLIGERVSLRGSADIIEMMESHRSRNRGRIWQYRLALKFIENSGQNGFEVRWLSRAERKLIEETDATYPLRGGRAWFILERNLCRKMVGSPLITRLRSHMAFGHCVDEILFHTLLISGGLLSEDCLERTNFRYLNGAPKNLSDAEDFEALVSGDFLFARKFDPARCPKTGSMVRSRIGFDIPGIP